MDKEDIRLITNPNPTTNPDTKYKETPMAINNNFRGYLNSKSGTYYIINEIVSGPNTKILSAVKFSTKKETNEKVLANTRYSIRYISKAWIRKEIFQRARFTEDKIAKFYENLKQSFSDYKSIKHTNIQELKDYIEDYEGIYIVLEFCDYTLKDYTAMVMEPIKNSKYPLEIKLRRIIIQILETVNFLLDNRSINFAGLLNIEEILISEYNDQSVNAIIVKFPHPFIASLLTILNFYTSFPSFYAPEFYRLFDVGDDNQAILKGMEFDMGNLLNKINQNFDIWALGYLLFELLMGYPPFQFLSLKDALLSLNEEFTYKISPYIVSNNILELINRCLQLDPQSRIQNLDLFTRLEELQKEVVNIDEFEKILKNRAANKENKEDLILFDLVNLTYDQYK